MENYLLVDKIIAAQTPKTKDVFKDEVLNFSTIIEIGFDRGGFSLWLYKNKLEDTKLVCYDINSTNLLVNNSSIDFRISDCFNENTKKEIKELIQCKGKTLVLCDGGNKELEFNIFSNYLKSGDVIMLHDFEDSKDDYALLKSKLNWPTDSESKLANILDVIEKQKLKPYKYNEFKNILWGAFEKI